MFGKDLIGPNHGVFFLSLPFETEIITKFVDSISRLVKPTVGFVNF